MSTGAIEPTFDLRDLESQIVHVVGRGLNALHMTMVNRATFNAYMAELRQVRANVTFGIACPRYLGWLSEPDQAREALRQVAALLDWIESDVAARIESAFSTRGFVPPAERYLSALRILEAVRASRSILRTGSPLTLQIDDLPTIDEVVSPSSQRPSMAPVR